MHLELMFLKPPHGYQSGFEGHHNPYWRRKQHFDKKTIYIGTLLLYNPISMMFM